MELLPIRSLDSDGSDISDLFTPPTRKLLPPPLPETINPPSSSIQDRFGVSIACQKAGQVGLHLTRRLQPRRRGGAAPAPLHSTNHHSVKRNQADCKQKSYSGHPALARITDLEITPRSTNPTPKANPTPLLPKSLDHKIQPPRTGSTPEFSEFSGRIVTGRIL